MPTAFVVLNWSGHAGIDLAHWPRTQAFVSRVAVRPATVTAMTAEGRLQAEQVA